MISNYPDLSMPLNQMSAYPDLSQPVDEAPKMVDTFLGKMPADFKSPEGQDYLKKLGLDNSPETLSNMISIAAGGPGMKLLGKGLSELPSLVNKGIQYVQPQKQVNQFMSELGQGKTAEENISDLAKRLSFGRNSAAEEALQHKRPVFQSLGENQITDIPESTSYLLNSKTYKDFSGDLKDMHDTFLNNPTLNNADALQQQIGGRIGKLRKLQYEGKLDRAGDDELSNLAKSRNNLMNDMDNFMSKQDPINKAQYDLFRSKWKNNVTPYDDSPILSEIVRRGSTEGMTPGEIKNIFSYPSAKIKKVVSDIGPSGQKNILYNELQSESPILAPDLVEALKKAKQFGYQQYIDPQMEALAKNLPKQYRISEGLKTVGKGTLGGLGGFMVGHPYLGALIGISQKPATDITKKIIEKMNK